MARTTLQAIFPAGKMSIVTVAASHQHKMPHLLMSTEKPTMYTCVHMSILSSLQITDLLSQQGSQCVTHIVVCHAD